MKLEDTVYQSITKYPGLFYHKGHPTLTDYEISRLSVLEHLFLTLGNGYAWVLKEGYMIDMEHARGADFEYQGFGWTATGPKYGKVRFDGRVFPPEKKDTRMAWEYVESWKRPKLWPFSFYEVYGDGIKVPDFLQPDWKQGMIDLFSFAVQGYQDGRHCWDGNNEVMSYKHRMKQIRHLKAALRKLA